MILRSFVVVLVLGCLGASGAARGDGGTVQLSTRAGLHEVTIFTQPTPARVGPVDISVLIQDSASGELVTGEGVRVGMSSRDRRGLVLHEAATTDRATNKLFYAATLEVPEPGTWDVAVDIREKPGGVAQLRFTLPVAPALPRWVSLWAWIAWPAWKSCRTPTARSARSSP